MRVLLTGGGSGGHISPALAVANYLRTDYPQTELLFVGGKLTMEGSTGPSLEQQLVVPTGIPFIAIHAGKLKRDSLVSWSFMTRLWGVVPGQIEAVKVVNDFHPDVVFSAGGYVSLPVVMAAWLLRIPIVVHEQTAVVGLANSIAGKLATAVAITFPQSKPYFPASKVVLTGNPLRDEVTNPPPLPDESAFGHWLEKVDRPIVYVTGGGLGSHILNQTIEQGLDSLLNQFVVIHQAGANAKLGDYDRLQRLAESLPDSKRQRYWLAKHFSSVEVGHIYGRAAVMVARAGANTVLEAAAVGLPTVFVPIPWVTHDEQRRNAQILVEAGTAVTIPEKELTFGRLESAIAELATSGKVTAEAEARAKHIVISDATKRIVDLLLSAGTKR